MSYHLSCFINQQCYGKVTLYFAFGLFSYKKKKNLCCWFKNLRYWTCLTWSKYCSSPSWKRWCYSSRLRSTCVFDQTMTLFCEWIFWTITTCLPRTLRLLNWLQSLSTVTFPNFYLSTTSWFLYLTWTPSDKHSGS